MGFTDEEVATIRQLVDDAGAGKEDNLMPILEGDAPDLYQRIDNDARKGMVDYFQEEKEKKCMLTKILMTDLG